MTSTSHGAFLRRIAFVSAALAAPSVWAEGPQDRFWGQLEYFFPTITSTARLDFPNTNRPGSVIRLEDELGLDERDGTPYLLLGTRLGDNWRIEFEYYRLERTATRNIGRVLEWGEVTFPVNAEISSRFDSSVYRLTGGYSFYRTPQAEFGGAFGLHVTDFTLGLSGQGTGGAGLGFQREERDTLVPLPTLGLYGTYVVADQWHLRGRIDYLTLKHDHYDGELINFMAAVDWRFSQHAGIGLGYRYVDYKLESSKPRFHGEINYNFKGPTIYLSGAF